MTVDDGASYVASDTAVATVDARGLVTARSTGNFSITGTSTLAPSVKASGVFTVN